MPRVSPFSMKSDIVVLWLPWHWLSISLRNFNSPASLVPIIVTKIPKKKQKAKDGMMASAWSS